MEAKTFTGDHYVSGPDSGHCADVRQVDIAQPGRLSLGLDDVSLDLGRGPLPTVVPDGEIDQPVHSDCAGPQEIRVGVACAVLCQCGFHLLHLRR